MYQVVIVEDDPMVAMLNRSFAEKDRRFQVRAVCRDGRTALDHLLREPPDLVILDVYMPVLTGLELLRALRAHGAASDVIMVTAANDAKTLDALLKLGVVDYLVKPFTCRRFQQALDTFCRHRQAVARRESVSQSEIDRLIFAHGGGGDPAAPKGMQEKTLTRIVQCLSAAEGEGFTSEEVAERAGLSAVTARRYLNYLTGQGRAVSSVNYDTGGRPSLRYRPAPP